MRGSDFGAFVRRSEEVYGLDVVSSGSWLFTRCEAALHLTRTKHFTRRRFLCARVVQGEPRKQREQSQVHLNYAESRSRSTNVSAESWLVRTLLSALTPFPFGRGGGRLHTRKNTSFVFAKLQKNVEHLGGFPNFFQKIFAQSLKSLKSLVIKQKSTPAKPHNI